VTTIEEIIVFSINQQQLAYFEAFGFVVLRRLLDDREVATLTGEVTRSLGKAFGGIGTDTDPDGTGGIRGDYLPLSVDRTPLSQALIADVGGVKFLIHLQPCTADGALRVVPGSHDPRFGRRVRAYWSMDPGPQGFEGWPVPAVVLETSPGDVIAFDLHLLHSSAGRDRRLAWTIEYLPWPGLGDPDRLHAVRDLVVDAVEFDDEGFDQQRWPAWREWAAGARGVASRRVAVERLRLLGVLGAGERG
jgi:hypothetical protein